MMCLLKVQGYNNCFKILPSGGSNCNVGVFRASGALELLIYAASQLQDFNIPSETRPCFIRPISDSASLALVSDILKSMGGFF